MLSKENSSRLIALAFLVGTILKVDDEHFTAGFFFWFLLMCSHMLVRRIRCVENHAYIYGLHHLDHNFVGVCHI